METNLKSQILLQSGNYFDFLNPEKCKFTIEDVAHGLSNLCRFVGQCSEFYSVAEHCYHCSMIINQDYAYDALLHDAIEAFTGDLNKPLKTLLPAYQDIEEHLERVVLKRLKLSFPLPASVKEADIEMLATEQRLVMNNSDDWHFSYGKLPREMKIHFWSPKQAKRKFLERYHQLLFYRSLPLT